MGFVMVGIASFSALGLSGAVLQMVSHGLIGASLFFLVGATYDRTHTLILKEMGGVGKKDAEDLCHVHHLFLGVAGAARHEWLCG
jgi:NADH:ubiquinone oxidoreductase subunit 4 (subunit M)